MLDNNTDKCGKVMKNTVLKKSIDNNLVLLRKVQRSIAREISWYNFLSPHWYKLELHYQKQNKKC